MPIDFHDTRNRTTYATRVADESWGTAIRALADPRGQRVADIGCGGGIYSLAFLDLDARSVTGVDFSQAMLSAANERAAGRPGLSFSRGDAQATGLPAGSFDLVFERALIHHLARLDTCFAEARRLLAPGGSLLVQERTPQDVAQPASLSHLRGYFFECFPRLLEFEARRRPAAENVEDALHAAGLRNVTVSTLWEDRRTYRTFEEYAQELAARTGRSILHELSDAELHTLIDYIAQRVPNEGPLVERDRWTLWLARM